MGSEVAIEIFSAFAADYLVTKGFVAAAGTSALGLSALQRMLKGRNEVARDILIDALRGGASLLLPRSPLTFLTPVYLGHLSPAYFNATVSSSGQASLAG
jgi:hypothetical protein